MDAGLKPSGAANVLWAASRAWVPLMLAIVLPLLLASFWPPSSAAAPRRRRRPAPDPMRARAAAAALAVVLVVPIGAGCQPAPTSVRVEIVIHYSHFTPSEISVPHGVPVRFVLISQDPIEHEWLIGDAAFHERHRTGTEPQHGERPNEVTIPPLAHRGDDPDLRGARGDGVHLPRPPPRVLRDGGHAPRDLKPGQAPTGGAPSSGGRMLPKK